MTLMYLHIIHIIHGVYRPHPHQPPRSNQPREVTNTPLHASPRCARTFYRLGSVLSLQVVGEVGEVGVSEKSLETLLWSLDNLPRH